MRMDWFAALGVARDQPFGLMVFVRRILSRAALSCPGNCGVPLFIGNVCAYLL